MASFRMSAETGYLLLAEGGADRDRSMAKDIQPRPAAFVPGLSAARACQLPGSSLPATHGRRHAVASQSARSKIPVILHSRQAPAQNSDLPPEGFLAHKKRSILRTLIYLEPLWFRGSSAFLRPHIELFILPMLKALQDRSGSAEICIVSNIILSLEVLAALRQSDLVINRLSVFTINSTHALADCELRPDLYAADLFRSPKKGSLLPFRRRVLNRSLFERIAQAFQEFNPDIVITTAQNRYVRQLCDDTSIPLLSSEFGPLPRIPYPSSRFLSLDGHLSDGPFHSVKDLRQALKMSTAGGRDGSYLAKFLERYHAAVSNHEQYNACRDFIQQIAREGSVAMLALQPEHWLTWEGSLTHAQGPAPIILRALGEMSADRLIVTFHPTPEGHVVGDQFAEIWLSNPALVRLPPTLAVNTSEIFLPFVDEVITVSSNVAMSAFLLGKRIKAIGNSYVGTLAKLSADCGATLGLREDVAQYLEKHYCVSEEIFFVSSASKCCNPGEN